MSAGVISDHYTSAVTTALTAAVTADAPLGWWRLDETSGTNAADSSGNARDATYTFVTVGATSLLTDGSGHSAGFSQDTGNGIAVASASWMNVSAFTVEALVKFTLGIDGSNGDAIASRYGSGGFQWLLWRNTTGKLALQTNTSVSGFVNTTGTTTVTLGATYHVVGTWDGTNTKLYVNGVQEGSTGTASGTLAASTETLRIGCYSNSPATVAEASIDEVAFYGTALSSARVAAHYAAV